jgi:DNA-binding CsgD family transcriptional regulator
MAGQSPTSDRMMEAREREVQALELRKQGASYRAIGRHLGISQTAAHDAVMRVLARFAAQSEKHTRELRQLEVERLDAAMSVVMPLVRRGDLAAVDRLVRLVDARARLLGLNAPAQVEVGGIAQGAPLKAEIVNVDADAFNRDFAALLGLGDGLDHGDGDAEPEPGVHPA